MTDSTLYLLDTNILIQFVRGKRKWDRIRQSYQLLLLDPRPLVSVVSVGEVRSLAYQWNWGERKLEQMEFILGYFKVLTIHTPAVLEAYARIDSHFKRRGVKHGKNDLWIAATASVAGATLLTTDHDYDDMDPYFLNREWIDLSSVRG